MTEDGETAVDLVDTEELTQSKFASSNFSNFIQDLMTMAVLTRTNDEVVTVKRYPPTKDDTNTNTWTSKQEPAWVRRISLQVSTFI